MSTATSKPIGESVSGIELRARRALAWAATDAGATWAFRAAGALAIPIYYLVGRTQWFNRDDWAFVLTRERMRTDIGWTNWLFGPQDGHWLTVPILLFEFVGNVFGLGSYWPFLVLALIPYAGSVMLVRTLCRRMGVSPWTTTLLAVLLLFFGAAWHNLMFAIQVCYNLSVVCFLAQLLLADHDGPLDRRDLTGGALGLVGVMTSGFGPIFMAGLATLLVLRRRWRALAVAVGPQAAAYLWWTWRWNTDSRSAVPPGDRSQLPSYVVRGVSSTFDALVGFPALGGLAVLATLVVLAGAAPWAARRLALAGATTVVVMFAAIGWERIGFGVSTAGSSRYVGVAALVIAPAFGLAVDRARRFGPEMLLAARFVLVVALAVNVGTLRSAGATFGRASRHEQLALSLVAGADTTGLPASHVPVPNSPDVTLGQLADLVEQAAIAPREPATDQERALLQAALTSGIEPLPMP